MPLPRPSRGFSLVELAIVLVLLTVLLGLGLGALNARQQSSATALTKQRQAVLRDALIAYLGGNRRLPCADDDAVTGINGDENCGATFGVVPWRTLGLSRENAEDGWGNLMSYAVFAQATPSCPGPGIDWKNADCFGEGKSGGITLNDGTAVAPVALASGVIAVIVSHGPNGLGAWTTGGSRNATPLGCEEAHNSQATACTVTAHTYFRGERPEVDDVVAYIPAAEALATLARQGSQKNAAAKMSEDMQQAIDEVVGTIATTGCTIGSATITLPVANDPWGNPYTPIPTTYNSASATVFSIASAGCTDNACTPKVASAIRALAKTELNAYLVKAGLAPCP
ncbi:MAG: prepilin-type N-terminal cleavage/methylation domain-containing protein [Rhodocyclaceae bacterium]|jgi:prepilin-type N-terminal cleavage/methylation domain-containing protein|nr:prepilin-type N-terminal cleavage/methylation domain-containing protein [Rhodocyclaceae bacterium]